MKTHKAFASTLAVAGAIVLTAVAPAASAADLTGVGVVPSRHKTLHFNINGCQNLYFDETNTIARMGVLRLDGFPRTDDAGNCVPYKLPSGFALVITSMKFFTQEDSNSTGPCQAGSLLMLTPGAPFSPVLHKGGGVVSRLEDACLHEIDFGSGLVVFSPGSELLIQAANRFLINADLYGYLVRK